MTPSSLANRKEESQKFWIKRGRKAKGKKFTLAKKRPQGKKSLRVKRRARKENPNQKNEFEDKQGGVVEDNKPGGEKKRVRTLIILAQEKRKSTELKGRKKTGGGERDWNPRSQVMKKKKGPAMLQGEMGGGRRKLVCL